MSGGLVRYAQVRQKMKREFVLLQGTGCFWKHCIFCDYYLDQSAEPFSVNCEVLKKVTGRYGVLDVINSGSAMELDMRTLEEIRKVCLAKKIHTLWFEAHYAYRNQLKIFADFFAPVHVKFRCGIESFNPVLRNAWKKGVPADVTAEETAKYFQGVCLLVGLKGQDRESILQDISLANQWFEYFSVNVFCRNSTAAEPDPALIEWFSKEVFPDLVLNPKADVLLENTDLGVG